MKISKFFKAVFVSSLMFFNASVFALPGVNPFIKDVSGEFVYYSDSTFMTRASVGFLCYDEGTYALRFYCPSVSLPEPQLEKDITLYVTVDTEKDVLTLTGEKIVGMQENEDVDIANYLHDLLYELAGRRRKLGELADKKIKQSEYFEQLGGNVEITYNSYVPIFNVEKIMSPAGDKILTVETVGQISSSQDLSFNSFKGIPYPVKDKMRGYKKNKKAKKFTAEYKNQTVALDSNWTAYGENLWSYGDWAILSLMEIKSPVSVQERTEFFEGRMERNVSRSSDGSYSVWNMMKKTRGKNQLSVFTVYVDVATGDVKRDFKIIKQTEDGFVNFTMTVFEDVYIKDKKYFDSIVDSYVYKN